MTHFLFRYDGILFLTLAAVAGCSANANSTDGKHGDADAQPDTAANERVDEINQIAERRDFESVPQVLDALEDDSPAVREAAWAAIVEVLGAGIRTRHFDSPEQRREAVDAYRRLYALAQETGVEHIIDTTPTLIDRMEDDDPEVRKQAFEDLERITGMSVEIDSAGDRRSAAEQYRALWKEWNAPGNMILQWHRHPEKLREHKRQRLEEIRRRRPPSDG